jgi:hypothetical protein
MSMFVMHFVSFREKVMTIVNHWEHEHSVCDIFSSAFADTLSLTCSTMGVSVF